MSYGLSTALVWGVGAAAFLAAPPTALAQEDPELCGDGIDNDGDGDIDEGFDVGASCSISSTNAFGTCLTGGTKQCTADGLGTECVLPDGVTLTQAAPETLAANDLSCFDGIDNDCDGAADVGGVLIEGVEAPADSSCQVATEQFCNGFDDDFDGAVDDEFGVGTPCNVGVGQCGRVGTLICDPSDPLQQATVCNVSPGAPLAEDTPGEFRCVDGLDNDCDGFTDLADASCQTAEICDGLDNDGDMSVDEDFSLGAACSVGVGACEVSGVEVCSPGGSATQCNAVAALPGVEGPTGPTCSDGIDNDCDGLTDAADPSCASADLAVACRLVPLNREGSGTGRGRGRGRLNQPGSSCNQRFRLEIDSNVDPSFLTAELQALDPEGNRIDLTPSSLPVQHGDELHLASRLDSGAWKVQAQGRFIDVFAPVPLVHVNADTGQASADAFCSPIPWMQVLEPSGQDQVVSASEGDAVKVLAPIPRVDPETLAIVVDGVDILDGDHLNIDPATAFPNPGAPLSGVIDINGHMVTVADLVVDAPSDLDELGRNSLTMKLENLGGGGHIVVVNGDPRVDALPPPNSAQCHIDDVLAAGTVSVFGITIEEPGEDEVVPAGSTTVEATISHGRQIDSAQVQGKPVSVGAQSCGPVEFMAFGETYSVDSCGLEIQEDLPQADLSAPLQTGSIDIGRNSLTVGAQDDLLNMTFADRSFTSGLGSTVAPSVQALSPQEQALVEEALEQKLENKFANSPKSMQPLDIQVNAEGTDITIAFVFGVSTDGLNKFFQSNCSQAKIQVEQAVDDALANAQFEPVKITDTGSSCEPTVSITGLDVDFVGDLICNVDPVTDFMTVSVELPDVLFDIGVQGRCKDTFLGVCVSETIVDVQVQTRLEDFGFGFTLNEQLVLDGGESEDPTFVEGMINIPPPDAGVEFNCITGAINDVVNFFTFGLVDFEQAAEDAIEGVFDEGINVDIAELLRSNHPDPLEVQKIEVNEQIIEADGIEAEQELLNIEITEAGFTGTIGASFTVPNPEGEAFEAVVNQPPAPMLPIVNAQELFFAASDDTFNLLFAAIGLQGALQTQCVAGLDGGGNQLTLEDTLPADCNTLTGADAFQTDVMRGRCQGAKGVDCSLIPNVTQALVCGTTQQTLADKNISKDTGLLFCANQPVAPRTLIKDDLLTTPVEAEIHANDMRITIALDRNDDGVFDPDQFFPLAQTCLGLEPDVTRDCKWSDACFDLNLGADFTLGGGGGNAQIVRTVQDVADSAGFQCSGGLNLGSGAALLTEAGASDPVDTIGDNIENIVRIFEAVGLELGGLVGLENRNVISIDVPGEPDDCANCSEYVGVTGDLIIP